MFRCFAQLQHRQKPQPQSSPGSSSSSSGSSARTRRRRSNSKAVSLESNTKGLLKRPVHQPPTLQPPPLPPDPGAGSAPQQQQQIRQAQAQQQLQQAALQHQKQQTAQMGTVSKPLGGARTSQDELVDYLIRSKLVKSARVADALRAVDRGKYVNTAYASRTDAYQDHPLAIGEGQTISAPHMHAICLELLEPHLTPGARVLDVGSGSGYLAAAMAKMVAPDGFVLGVDKVPELVVRSRASLQAANPELLAAQGGHELLRITHGNALSDMLASEPPFAAIHVGAAADEMHQVLLDKLAPGGRMVIPVGPHYSYQVLMAVDKDAAGHVTTQALMDVGYVPLTRPSEYEDGSLL
uniref:protein-L-isoaspartate(D-aspartate) O-methyltransferase n=1 Tax=Tetradesmus obliquus TaxID=3088 RepID=A0A383WIY6_TETOB|eukprot:jgi/Sobl393_1/2724/SZX76706.1